eukprot:TRINITY_DN12117_c0_g1_i1.p1 TRINITY_DN12117_c0_g1~~TRINITY_DN12117_c0_g1_i1.p1  ORF type:complete len:262 (-),score=42.97 TRINITY_DN12117_c0_g1_i1:61-846(-)
MVNLVLSSFPSLMWGLVLLLIVSSIAGTCLAQAAISLILDNRLGGDTPTQSMANLDKFFGTIPRAVLTLIGSVLGGISWGEPLDILFATVSPIYAYLFLSYVIFVILALLNLLTGFFCEHAMDAATLDREMVISQQMLDQDKIVKNFKDLYSAMDLDNSGKLTLQELSGCLHNEKLVAYFAHLGIHIYKVWDTFKLMDENMDGEVTIDEFVHALLRLRGPAKASDVEQVIFAMKREMSSMTQSMAQRMDNLETRLQEILCR